MRPHHTAARTSRPRRHTVSMLSVGVGACLAGAWVSGCSVIYDLDTKQCSATSDCQALGGVFAEYECIENICQEPSGCTTNAECLDSDTGSGTPVVCIERECVPLLSAECPKVLPNGVGGDRYLDMLRNDPLILAATGDVTQSSDNVLLNYELALGELDSAVGGIGPNASTQVVMLACDGNAEGEALDREMDHVINKLRIPGIATQISADSLQRAFNEFGDNPDVQPFFLSALDSDPVLETNFVDDNRVWSLLPSASIVARTYPPLLTQIVNHLGLAQGEARVAVVQATGIRFLTNTMSALTQPPENYGLYFNGGGVSANGSNYLAVTVVQRETVAQETIDALVDFRPHVVLSVGYGEFVDFVIPGIEAGWDAESGGQARPFYVLSAYNYNDPALSDLVVTTPTLRLRLAGVNAAAAADPTVYNTYTAAWDRRFAADDLDGVRGYENYYDAAYYLIYAAAAAAGGGGVSTGDQLAAGMGRLLSGSPIPVGTANLVDGFLALSQPRNNISLIGTMGPPDFDPITGTRGGGGSVWCLDAGGNYHADVLRYVPPAEGQPAMTASLSGVMPTECITSWQANP